MRDPQGSLSIESGRAIRKLNSPLCKDDFLFQQEAVDLVESGQLIHYLFINELEITSPLVPFVTYPYEWTNAQLYDAADLTLSIAEKCEKKNWELKDASAWNIIFDGTAPIFCDHLSFQKITNRNWWAFAQYVRHFILPLCVAKYAGLESYESFKLTRDGLKPLQVKKLLGWRRFLTRYWSLLIEIKVTNQFQEDKKVSTQRHINLYALLRFYLKGVRPKNKISIWSEYVETKDHYEQESNQIKSGQIENWLKQIKPEWVTDFGCNTGEYTRIANKIGAKVIAIDLDHECIQQLYQLEKGNKDIYPVVADLDDIFGTRGWVGREFEGLLTRVARVNEVSLMLALIHHIAISNSIPYTKIAEFAKSITKKWLIVELLNHEDPLVKLLSKQRNRKSSEFTLEAQMKAFSEHFEVIEICKIKGTHRELVLMRC